MPSFQINVELDIEGPLREQDHRVVGSAMDKEVEAFSNWFRSQGNGPLVPAERAILKTYLAWKLIYEEDVVEAENKGRGDG